MFKKQKKKKLPRTDRQTDRLLTQTVTNVLLLSRMPAPFVAKSAQNFPVNMCS